TTSKSEFSLNLRSWIFLFSYFAFPHKVILGKASFWKDSVLNLNPWSPAPLCKVYLSLLSEKYDSSTGVNDCWYWNGLKAGLSYMELRKVLLISIRSLTPIAFTLRESCALPKETKQQHTTTVDKILNMLW